MFLKTVGAAVVLAFGIYWNSREKNRIKLSPLELKEKYDYIIVGGGTAGCILAARLSEDRNSTVLLIEAGGATEKNQMLIDIPAFAGLTIGSEIDWKFRTVPQKFSAFGMNEQVLLFPAGKVLGGSSTINMLTYVRGNPKDFDLWESLGNPGWSYKDVLPFFKKLEKVTHHGIRLSKYRGKKGPIHVGRVGKTLFGRMFMRGIKNSGIYKKVKDYNGAIQEGFSRVQRNVGNGLRQSTASEYILPAAKRSNLDVIIHSHVTKILLDESKAAVGVQFKHDSEENFRKVSAGTEVILSSGAINSAQLLMLSGIGPESDLKALKIPVLVNSPVGQKLKDHVAVDLNFVMNSSVGMDPSSLGTTSAWLQWKLFGKGPLEALSAELIGFVFETQYCIINYDFISLYYKILTTSKVQSARKNRSTSIDPVSCGAVGSHLSESGESRSPYIKTEMPPDLQYLIFPMSVGSPFISTVHNLKAETVDAYSEELQKKQGMSVLCIRNNLQAHGRVWLDSSDPFRPAKIDPSLLDNSEDVDALAFGLDTFLNLTSMPEMSQFGIQIAETPLKGCSSQVPWSAEYFKCLVKHRTIHMYHQTSSCLCARVIHLNETHSTCPMGPDSDSFAVVDHKLRVKGVSRLRVIDGSVFPWRHHVSGNMNGAVMMIAEKMADSIRQENNFN